MAEKIVCNLTLAEWLVIKWGREHPFGRIKELEWQNGQPMKAVVVTDDKIGTELVRFDKITNGG